MYAVNVLLKRFQLNGHTIGFYSQTQKLELRYIFIILLTLRVKGLNLKLVANAIILLTIFYVSFMT